MAEIVNEQIFAGEALYFNIALTDIDSIPFDLLAYRIRFRLRAHAGGTTLVQKTSGGSGIYREGRSGYSFTLDATETEDLAGWYYIESMVENGSTVFFVFSGVLQIKQ